MFSNVASEQVPVRNLAIENISGINLLLFLSTSDIIVILNCTHVDALKLVVIMQGRSQDFSKGGSQRQSSQVDLLGKSGICNGAAVSCDAKGDTPLGGSGGMLPQEILKNGSS